MPFSWDIKSSFHFSDIKINGVNVKFIEIIAIVGFKFFFFFILVYNPYRKLSMVIMYLIAE